MTVYQQDKHTGKVESSFLSPWIGNPRKQVQQAGGNAGEQDVAYAALLTLEVPKGGVGREDGGHFSQLRLIPVMSVGLQRRGTVWGNCLGAVPPGTLSSVKARRKKRFPQDELSVLKKKHAAAHAQGEARRCFSRGL